MPYVPWEERSKWDHFKFRLSWKYNLFIADLSHRLSTDHEYGNLRNTQEAYDYMIWTYRQLGRALIANVDDKSMWILKLINRGFAQIEGRKLKYDNKYQIHAMFDMAHNAHMYRWYILTNNTRAEDAHMWFDIMLTFIEDTSV